jgi:hypothetical protein
VHQEMLELDMSQRGMDPKVGSRGFVKYRVHRRAGARGFTRGRGAAGDAAAGHEPMRHESAPHESARHGPRGAS